MRTIRVDPVSPDREALRPAADALRGGGLVAFPTETVYGLGALALDEAAAGRIFSAKGRPADDPLIVHVGLGWDLGRVLAEITPAVAALVEAHWPGPLTIVAPKHPDVPDLVTSGRPTVAVRCPSHPVAAVLLDLVGEPVAAPSANRFSYVSPTTADHVVADLGEVVDVLVDGGSTMIGIESTIVAVDDDGVTVLRRGSVTLDAATVDTSSPASIAPGRLDAHYAPRTPTLALAPGGRPAESMPPGVLVGYDDSRQPPPGWHFVSLGAREDPAAVGRRLYALLREVDAARPPVIVVELTGKPGLGAAIDDRIRRAAGGQSAN